MIIIADSGSTKTDWALISDKNPVFSIQSAGINPFFQTIEEIQLILKESILNHTEGDVKQIFFYGAGCADEKSSLPVTTALRNLFPASQIFVNSDMLAAARSLFGREKGIACILGTGSNNCLYDGIGIVNQVGSLGFWMGDEGSGGYLGKQLVKDYLLDELPLNLQLDFQQEYPEINRLSVLDIAYKQPFPNRYFAGFSLFLGKHRDDPYCKNLFTEAFDKFLNLYVVKHPGSASLTVSFTGSIAWYFNEELNMAIKRKGLTLGTIQKSPLEGLIMYHTD
jgi:glucosamine kinase